MLAQNNATYDPNAIVVGAQGGNTQTKANTTTSNPRPIDVFDAGGNVGKNFTPYVYPDGTAAPPPNPILRTPPPAPAPAPAPSVGGTIGGSSGAVNTVTPTTISNKSTPIPTFDTSVQTVAEGSNGPAPALPEYKAGTAATLDPTTNTLETKEMVAERVALEAGDTVEGRLQGIIDADSPLMQQARTRAYQEASKKGLLNSSMAVQAAQAGVIEKATPIAMQDAQTAAQFKLSNQSEQNKAGMFNAGEHNKASQLIYQLSEQGRIDMAKIAAGIEGDSRLINEKGQIDLTMQEAAADRAETLQAQKGQIDKMLINADAQTKAVLNAQMAAIDKEMEGIKQAYLKELNQQKYVIDLALQNAAAKDALVLEQLRGSIDKEIANIQASAQITAANIDRQTALETATMNNQNDIDVAKINNEAGLTGQQSQNVTSLTTGHLSTLAAINSDPNMSPEQKEAQRKSANESFNTGMNLVKDTQGVDYLDMSE